MGTIKAFEATVLTIAETEFLRDLSDTTLLAFAGELLGAEWSGSELSAVTVRELLLEPGQSRGQGRGLAPSCGPSPRVRWGVDVGGDRDGRADAEADCCDRRGAVRGDAEG